MKIAEKNVLVQELDEEVVSLMVQIQLAAEVRDRSVVSVHYLHGILIRVNSVGGNLWLKQCLFLL